MSYKSFGEKTCLYLFFCSTSSMFLSIFFCHPNFFKRIHENLQQYKDICKCIEDQWYCKSSILHINKASIPKIVNADKSVDLYLISKQGLQEQQSAIWLACTNHNMNRWSNYTNSIIKKQWISKQDWQIINPAAQIQSENKNIDSPSTQPKNKKSGIRKFPWCPGCISYKEIVAASHIFYWFFWREG